jgi:TPR repeat protein
MGQPANDHEMNSPLAAHYETLGLPESATFGEIKKARRRLAKKLHPDLIHSKPNLQRKNEEKLKQVNLAADILEAHLSANTNRISAAQTEEDAKRAARKKRRAAERERARQNRRVFSQVHRLAKRGNAEAQYRVAMMHRDGLGCIRNKGESFRWFTKAATNGDPRSAIFLGFACAWGINMPVDHLKAIKLYEAAAKKGFGEAHFQLGLMHYFGIGVKQEFELAVKFYRNAIDQGYKVCEGHPDTCDHYRKETPKEYFKRYNWFALAVQRATRVRARILGDCSDVTPPNDLVFLVRELSDELAAKGPVHPNPSAQLKLFETASDSLAAIVLAVNWEADKYYDMEGLGPPDEF